MNEQLPWKACKDGKVDEVKMQKERCLKQPDKYLWKVTKEYDQIKNIFYHLQSLKYEDNPDYAYIRSQLHSILERDTSLYTPSRLLNSSKKVCLDKKEQITSKKRLMKEKRKKIINKRKDMYKPFNKNGSLDKNIAQGKDYFNNNNIEIVIKDKNKANPFALDMNNNQPVNSNQNYPRLENGIPNNIQFINFPNYINPMGTTGQINSMGLMGSLNQMGQMRTINPINQMNPSNKLNSMNEMKLSQPMMPLYQSFVVMNSIPDPLNMPQNMFMPF